MERTGPVFDFEDDSSEDDSKDQETSTDKQSKKRKAAPLLGKSLFEYASESTDDKKPASLDGLFEKPKQSEDKSGFFEVPKENSETPNNSQEIIDQPEIITEDESRLIAENLLSDRQSNINEELEASESGSAEEAGLLNAGRLIESIKEKIAGGLPPSDEVLDEATEETVRELDLESAPEEANDQVDEEPALELAQQGVEPGTYDEEPDQDPAAQTPISPPTSGAPPTPPSTSPSAGVIDGSTPPPSGRSALPGFSDGYEPSAPLDAEVAGETPATSNSAIENESRNNRRRDLLVGGIVGYLIGRRRGRIKTEERLMPVQKSLEKQVKELDLKLEEREAHIRKLTEEKMAKAESKPEAKIKPSDKKESPVSVDKKPEVPPLGQEPEKQSLTTEAEPSDRREISLAKQEETKPRPAAEAKPIALSDQEILRRASRIEAQGNDLKRLFESGRLDKDKLRAIVEAHEAGYDYRRILLNSLRPERSVGIEKLTQHDDNYPDQTFTRSAVAGSVYQNPFNNPGQAQQSMNQYNAPSSDFSGSSNLQQKLLSNPSAIIILAVVLGLIIAGLIILTF